MKIGIVHMLFMACGLEHQQHGTGQKHVVGVGHCVYLQCLQDSMHGMTLYGLQTLAHLVRSLWTAAFGSMLMCVLKTVFDDVTGSEQHWEHHLPC